MLRPSTRTAKLDLRLSPEAEQESGTAAESAGRTVRVFVLERALVRAEETLANRNRFGLDAEHWQALPEAPDAPLRELARVGRLRQSPTFLDARSDC